MDDLTQARDENRNLKATIYKMEQEIQDLRSELKYARRFIPGEEDEDDSDIPDISDTCRPREWTMELVELAIQVYCNYCWENVLSESERNELHEMGIHDYEALYRYAKCRAPTTYDDLPVSPAARIFWQGPNNLMGIALILMVKEDLLEFPRPNYACSTKKYSNRESYDVPPQPPPTKAEFERFLLSHIVYPKAADVMASIEGLWASDK